MKKKILLTLMVIVLSLNAFGTITISAETSGHYEYSVSNGKAKIIKVESSLSGEVIIPSTLDGYSVTSIGEYVFAWHHNITSITIPEGVTSIGSGAFYNCMGLTSITIPDSVTSIGESAFRACYDLASITIPDSVTSIGEYAFEHCRSLTSITIPDSVTSIGSYAFDGCSSLTSISVGTNNPNYSSMAGVLFDKNKTMLIKYPEGKIDTSYLIPDSVTSIGTAAFLGCDSLTSITIPEGVTSIGTYAFQSCSSLTSITIPEGVTSIEMYLFNECSSLRSITIPEGVPSIGLHAFSWCDSLTSITIPNSVTSIGEYAFSVCSSLATVNYAGNEEEWNSISIGSDNDCLINAARVYINRQENIDTDGAITYHNEVYESCEPFEVDGKMYEGPSGIVFAKAVENIENYTRFEYGVIISENSNTIKGIKEDISVKWARGQKINNDCQYGIRFFGSRIKAGNKYYTLPYAKYKDSNNNIIIVFGENILEFSPEIK